MVTAIVFDLDDTLYDEIEYCRSGFAAVARFLAGSDGVPPAGLIFVTLWNHFTTGDRSRTFNLALDDLGIGCDERRIAELVEVYRSHVPLIPLPPDSEQVLRTLSGKYSLGLLTDGFLPAQQLKVRALRIENYFKSIVYTEQLGREFWKPSPAGFERILQELGAKAQDAVYVADNEQKDFIAPNSLGMATVQLKRPARLHTSAGTDPGAAARHVIAQIGELPALINTL